MRGKSYFANHVLQMSPADSEAEVDVKRAVKPRRGEANLWSLPPKEQRWTSAEE